MRIVTRVVLAVAAFLSLETAAWGLLSPEGFFDNFPGGGRHWVSALPPFNEHLTRDFAAALFAIGVLAAWAAITMDRRLVQAALLTVALASLPHAIYHSTTTDHYATSDNILSVGGLWLEVVAPLVLLVGWSNYSKRAGSTQTAPSL